MYFKINKTGCNERKGLAEVRYDLYLDENDYGYSEHHVQGRNNPFCCHFCQFEPNVTDEEILFVGELALDMAYKNWQDGNLHWNSNMPIIFSSNPQKKIDCLIRIEQIKNTDFYSVETVGKYSLRV
jgi:hypothetical protein